MILNLKSFREILISSIETSSKVFIAGHTGPDYDSIGSAMGLQALAKSLGKEAYIVVGDDLNSINEEVRKVIEDNKEKSNIITLDEKI